MDLSSLRDQVSNLTLYDLKAGVRKVQNAVMNYTEMEAKVREATNNEPWGASSSLMQEIANGTHSYQLLNEIMPLIYKRFTDKTAEEWRQIYKSLQLLEFLVKNGSERVIDDARSHLSLLRMLRQFHFIDQNGKDQGVNVRNRAQELAKLLSDVDAIRGERKKARANRNKFGGVEGGIGMGGGLSSGGRYDGFGGQEAEYGGYTGRVYGDGGGYGGNQSDYQDTQRRTDKFEEYDEGDDGVPARATKAPHPTLGARQASLNTIKREGLKPKPKEPEQDLFDFSDEPPTPASIGVPQAASNGKAPTTPSSALDDAGILRSGGGSGEDDFDDFQSAASPSIASADQQSTFASLSPPPMATSTTTSATQFAAPQPVSATQAPNYNNIFSTASPAPPSSSATRSLTPLMTSTLTSPPLQAQQPARPAAYVSTGPNYFTSVPAAINAPPVTSPSSGLSTKASFTPRQPAYGSSTVAASLGKPVSKPATDSGGGDIFASLWSTAGSSAGISTTSGPSKGPDLASMAKAKSDAELWGSGVGSGQRPGAVAPTPDTAARGRQPAALGNGLDDLLG